LEVNTSRVKTAHDIKDNINAFLANEFFPQLELLFDQYDLSESVIRFDQLNISLSLAKGNDFSEVNYKIIKEVKEKLELHKQSVRKETKQADRDVTNKQWNTKQITARGNNQQVFLFFLQNGCLPWYGKEEQIDEITDLEYWNKSLQNKGFLDNLHRIISTDESVAERFSLQFSAEIIWSFLLRIQPKYKKYETEINQFISIADVATNHYFMLFVLSVFTARKRSQIYSVYQQLLNQLKKSSSLLNRKSRNQITKATLQFIQTILPEKLRLKPEAKKLADFLETENNRDINFGKLELAHKSDDKSFKKKLKKTKTDGIENAFPFLTGEEKEIALQNAGLILLHPFLKPFFIQTGLANKQGILEKNKVNLAVQVLHFLATGNESFFEGKLVLEKFLCGLSLKRSLPKHSLLSEEIKAESEILLKEVIRHWPALKNSSVNDLRHMFIQRDGKLIQKEKAYKIIVERKAADLLLENLSWNISMIKLPWIKEMIIVDW